jgi:hypothetical protein
VAATLSCQLARLGLVFVIPPAYKVAPSPPVEPADNGARRLCERSDFARKGTERGRRYAPSLRIHPENCKPRSPRVTVGSTVHALPSDLFRRHPTGRHVSGLRQRRETDARRREGKKNSRRITRNTKKTKSGKEGKKKSTTVPGIPAWSPTAVLTWRYHA